MCPPHYKINTVERRLDISDINLELLLLTHTDCGHVPSVFYTEDRTRKTKYKQKKSRTKGFRMSAGYELFLERLFCIDSKIVSPSVQIKLDVLAAKKDFNIRMRNVNQYRTPK